MLINVGDMGVWRKSLVFAPLGITAILAGSLFLCSQQTDTKPYVLKPIKTFYPIYPEHLKKEGIAGEVIVRVTVNEKGDVEIRTANPIIIKRKLHPELDQLALEAVRPSRLGRAVKKYIYRRVSNHDKG